MLSLACCCLSGPTLGGVGDDIDESELAFFFPPRQRPERKFPISSPEL